MKLMTKELANKFCKYPLYSQEDKGFDAQVVVKYFNPCGRGTWLITEGSLMPDDDWLLWGYCHIFEWEWGFVSLRELESIHLPCGMGIKRDLYSEMKTVKEMIPERDREVLCIE